MPNFDATSFGDYYGLLSNPEQGFETRNYNQASGRTGWVSLHALGPGMASFFFLLSLYSILLSLVFLYCPICAVDGTFECGK